MIQVLDPFFFSQQPTALTLHNTGNEREIRTKMGLTSDLVMVEKLRLLSASYSYSFVLH